VKKKGNGIYEDKDPTRAWPCIHVFMQRLPFILFTQEWTTGKEGLSFHILKQTPHALESILQPPNTPCKKKRKKKKSTHLLAE
jgi:hypothetical protein